ncbi:hypothetical protein AB0H83_21950 [Dactylosporangium sp. NPDC050688]|uniref:hypothetical protein n=1 Tax=Dactylosporangium sp. NPDC050688 TaxID=3157217 RepID=UPI0033FAD545
MIDLPDAAQPGPVLTLLVGPAGMGLGATLTDLADRARRGGRVVVAVSPDPAEQRHAWLFLTRLAGEAALPGSPSGASRIPIAGRTPESLVTTVCRLLRGLPDPLVLVDGGQWVDAASVAAVPALLRGLAGSRVRCVATVSTPVMVSAAPDGTAMTLARLRRDGLLTVRTLRPLEQDELDDPGARPEAQAVLAALRAAPQPVWPVAVAIAALHPLGAGAAAHAATVLDLTPSAVAQALGTLVHMGVLRGGGTGGWRFASAAVVAALRAADGPYRSRQLAREAVHAIWDGPAGGAAPTYLGEQLVTAGTAVDPERSAGALMMLSDRLPMTDGRTVQWFAAASRLTRDPVRRVQALLGLAAAATNTGDHALALRSARSALDEIDGQQPRSDGASRDGLRLDARLLSLRAMHGLGDAAGLARAAKEAGTPVEQAATLSMTDCWAAAERRLGAAIPLEPARPAPSGRSAVVRAVLGERMSGVVGPWRPTATEAPAPPGDPLHRDRVAQRAGILLTVGDLTGAQRLLRVSQLDAGDLPWAERALLAWRRGAWFDALDHAAAAELLRSATPPVDAVLARAVAVTTLAQGRPLRALDRSMSMDSSLGLPHLRELTRAEIEAALGDAERAGAALTRAAARAERDGVSLGTDEIWLRLTELARSRGDYPRARQYAARAAHAARSIGTPLAELHARLAQVAAETDAAAAGEALTLARDLDQAWVLANTLERVATWGAGPAGLLAQAYELLGSLDAILDRARVRAAMRTLGVTVPHRSATAAENERLLAELVADGLSGQRLAAALWATAKSVESRLGRLFARTGYRSRAALAAAVAAPDPAGGHPTRSSSSVRSGTATARHAPRSATNARLTVT